MDNDTITMAHGAGGQQTAELIGRVFKEHFDNPDLVDFLIGEAVLRVELLVDFSNRLGPVNV